MGDIVKLNINTTLDIDAPTMLRNIADEIPNNAFVIVWPNDGTLPTYHSSTADIAVTLMRLNSFIHKFYNGDFGE